MSLRRASAIGVPDSLKYVCIMSLLQLILRNQFIFRLACCTHPLQIVDEVMLGKYGAVVAYEVTNSAPENVELPEEVDADKLPRQLCQHVIGEDDGTLSYRSFKQIVPLFSGMNPRTVERPEGSSESTSSEDETALYDQEFVACPGHTVGQILDMIGWRVHSFIRFECGESDQANSA